MKKYIGILIFVIVAIFLIDSIISAKEKKCEEDKNAEWVVVGGKTYHCGNRKD